MWREQDQVQGWLARLGFPGALPQRRVVWMWFGAFPGAFVTKPIELTESRSKWQGLVGAVAVVVGSGKVAVTH